MSASHEHWFDRLAATHTRRQLLKSALAGLALTLPFARAAAAPAALRDDPNACRTGCFYTSHRQYATRVGNCYTAAASGAVGQAFNLLLFAGAAPLAAGMRLVQDAQLNHCYDQALLQQKAMQFDCLQPGCPGFDPSGPGGPCEVCLQGAKCCPDPTDGGQLGYVCCACCGDNGQGCGVCPGP